MMAGGDSQKDINLEEIMNLPAEEFHAQILAWIKGDVSKSLQTKLRELMAELFSETMLGKTLISRSKQNQALVLSPLVLSLNTIVAEFLYAQNCHFTLSTFASEVPFQNTLPDFAGHPNFKFTEADLSEVFKAINISPQLRDEVKQMYYSTDSCKLNYSLLHCLFTVFLRQNRTIPAKENAATNTRKPTTRDLMNVCNCEDELSKLPHLNKYLDACAQRISQMGTELTRLKSSQTDVRATSVQLHQLNQSFEELKSKSSVSNRKTSLLVNGIEKLTVKLEACAISFGQLADTMKAKAMAPKTISHQKTYSEFVKELKDTPHGQKFIRKIEKSIMKTLQEEKMKLEVLLKEERTQMKIKYKQRLITKIESQLKHHLNDKTKHDDRILEEIRSLEQRLSHERIKTDELQPTGGGPKPPNEEKQLKAMPDSVVNQVTERPLLPLSSHTAFVISIDPTPPPAAENVVNINPSVQPAPETNQPPPAITNNQPQLSFPQLEPVKTDVIDTAVHVAKQRLTDLELESERLENQFSKYLHRQEEQKILFNTDVSQIWDNYNRDRDTLNKSFLMGSSSGLFKPPEPVLPVAPMQKACEDIEIDLGCLNAEDDFQIENPFKDFNAEQFVKKRPEVTKSRMRLESHKSLGGDQLKTPNEIAREFKKLTMEAGVSKDCLDKRLAFDINSKHCDLTFTIPNKKRLNLKESLERLSECRKDVLMPTKHSNDLKETELPDFSEQISLNQQPKKEVKFKDIQKSFDSSISDVKTSHESKDSTDNTKVAQKTSIEPAKSTTTQTFPSGIGKDNLSSTLDVSIKTNDNQKADNAGNKLMIESSVPTPGTSKMSFEVDISRNITISNQTKVKDNEISLSSDSDDIEMKLSTGQRTSSDGSSWN